MQFVDSKSSSYFPMVPPSLAATVLGNPFLYSPSNIPPAQGGHDNYNWYGPYLNMQRHNYDKMLLRNDTSWN